MQSCSSLQDKLIEILQCAICLENYNDPKTLSCGHSFCKRCLEKMLLKKDHAVCCPTCRQQHHQVSKRNDIEKLHTSLHLRQTLDLLSTIDVSDKSDIVAEPPDHISGQKKTSFATQCIDERGYCKIFDIRKITDKESKLLVSSSDDEWSDTSSFEFELFQSSENNVKPVQKKKLAHKVMDLVFKQNIRDDFLRMLECGDAVGEVNKTVRKKCPNSKAGSRRNSLYIEDDAKLRIVLPKLNL